MDLELELISDKAEKYGGHSVALARVSVVALSSQPVDHDKRLINDPNERLCQEYSDEEEEFSSEAEAEGSDSEPTLEVHRRKSRGKIPTNARVRKTFLLSSIEIFSTSQPLNLSTSLDLFIRTIVRPSISNLEKRPLDSKLSSLLYFTAKKSQAKVYSPFEEVQSVRRFGSRSRRNWTKAFRYMNTR